MALEKGWLPKLIEIRREEAEDLFYLYLPLSNDSDETVPEHPCNWYDHDPGTTALWFDVMRARNLQAMNSSLNIITEPVGQNYDGDEDDFDEDDLGPLPGTFFVCLSELTEPGLLSRVLELDFGEFDYLMDNMCGILARAIASTNLRSTRSLVLQFTDGPCDYREDEDSDVEDYLPRGFF